MTRQDQATQDRSHPETNRGHYLLEVLGILSFVLLLLLIGVDFYQGCSTSATCGLRRSWLSWLTWPLTSSPGSYTSSPTTSVPTTRRSSGPTSSNPSGSTTSTRKGSSATTSLTPTAMASLPFMLGVWIIVPLETTYDGYLFGIFSLFLCLAAFLSNQFHKW